MGGTSIPVGSGLGGQILAKDEATFGVAPPLTSGADSFEFKSETLELKKTPVQGEGLAAGKVYHRTKRRVVTNYDVTGDIQMDLITRNLGFWLRYMIGDFADQPAQIGSTGIYQTVFQPVSGMQGHSFTVQKGVPTVDNATVEPFTYVGNKIASWSIGVSTGAIGTFGVTLDGRNELAGAGNSDPLNGSVPALATWAPASTGLGLGVFHFKEATLFSGGTPTLSAGGTISAPTIASGSQIQNTTGRNVLATISGGTVTSVVVNGQQVGTSAGSYLVPANNNGQPGYIQLTYTGTPTWTWAQAILSLAGETSLANVKDVTMQQSFSYDVSRMFVGNAGFKSEQIENNYRALSGSATVEWLSSEAIYNAFSADSTTSLELKFVGPTVSTSNYLLDIIIPNIKFEGESPKIAGPQVVTQATPFTGLDDEATVPIQVTYQSEDAAF